MHYKPLTGQEQGFLVKTLETDKTQGRDSQELKVKGKGGTYYAPTHGYMPPCLLGCCSGVDGEAMPGLD